MNCKVYNEKNLMNKNYAVISYDLEDGDYAIVNLYDDLEKAKKRSKFLNDKVNVEKNLVAYGVMETVDERIKYMVNYESEEE